MRACADFADEGPRRDLDVTPRLVVAPLAVRVLLVAQQPAIAEFRWTLQRYAAGIVRGPDPLQIGLAPRRPRCCVWFIRRTSSRRLCGGACRDADETRREDERQR